MFARGRGLAQPGDVDRRGRARYFVRLTRLERVVHRFDAAVGRTADDDVADFHRAVLDQQLSHHAAIFVHLALQAGAIGRAARVGLVIVQFGDRQQRFQQIVDALAGQCTALHQFRFAAPFARQQFVGRQLLHDTVDIDAGQIDLVERHDDRYAGRTGMADRFFRLRHHAVIGGHDQHCDVGDVGAAGPHLGKRFVARGIDERDRPAVLFDAIGSDVLRDAAALAADDVDADNLVQQRRLAVIDVSQEGHYRRPEL